MAYSSENTRGYPEHIPVLRLVTLFVIRAWKARAMLAARDRRALVTSLAVAFTTFVIAPQLINWVRVPTAIWFIAVALLASGVSARCCAGRTWRGSAAHTRFGTPRQSAPA